MARLRPKSGDSGSAPGSPTEEPIPDDEGKTPLGGAPLGYRAVRQSGSHRRMEAPGHPPLAFVFHDKATIPSGLVRKILITTKQTAGGPSPPDVEGWSAAGDTYAEVVKLADEGIPFALGHDASLEHYVPAGEHVAA